MKRSRDRRVLDHVKSQPCLICGSLHGTDPHHVTSVGAGGKDTLDNVMPLCRRHHTLFHCRGLYEFIIEHPSVMEWLRKNNREDIISKFEFYMKFRREE